MNETSQDLKHAIESIRQEIEQINRSVDAWNREVAEGRAEPDAYSYQLAKAARDKASLEVRAFELDEQLKRLEAEPDEGAGV